MSDLLRVRMNAAGFAGSFPTEVAKMLAPELVAGLRMDVNRPFGNGRDDNNNNIVDEPLEMPESAYWNTTNMSVPARFTTSPVPTNPVNGIDVNNNNLGDDNALARQLYARHLYILMMLLKDENFQIDYNGDGFAGSTADQVETAYAIAQWAVNVVDFRDRDSIMTPFQFNIYPFKDGWTATNDLYNPPANTGLVWGCERPELLITETLAFHDRRTEDLSTEPNGHTTTDLMMPDADYDQRIPPRGSLFVELYNPWVTQSTVTNAGNLPSAYEVPGEFYSVNTTANTATGVNLNATSLNGGSPVWRMLITLGSAIQTNGQPKDPDHPFPAYAPTLAEIERSIYFVQPPQTITGDGQKYFQNRLVAPILPGRYGVIGSAGLANTLGGTYTTTIGRLVQTASNTADTAHDGNAQVINTRRIVLSPSANPATPQVQVLLNGSAPSFSDIQPPIAIVIDQAQDATGNVTPRSISVSEPTYGYLAGTTQAFPAEPIVYNPVQDVPLDNANPVAPMSNRLWRFIHLQRLADPTLPYSPKTNPYRTIDTAPIALSVFNGLTPPGTIEAIYTPTGVCSTQRGTQQSGVDKPMPNLLWVYEPQVAAITSIADGSNTHNVPFFVSESLGYLNQGYGTAGNAMSTFTSSSTAPSSYRGSPNVQPFPWLNWNNRPYVGQLELMIVPKSRSSRLTLEYAPDLDLDATNPHHPYAGHVTSTSHLFPFFDTVAASQPVPPNLHRVFEYLTVPSRFVGTETELDPQTMNALPAFDTTGVEQTLVSFLHPPFNRVSNYREPGRININTISSDYVATAGTSQSTVWNGVLNASAGDTILAGTSLNWLAVAQSRQGKSYPFRPTTGNLDSTSIFGNPFRSAAGEALLLPLTKYYADRDEVDVTLFRPVNPATNAPATDTPLFGYTSTQLHNNSSRNPYFRHQHLQRISNVVTTRSNVYAIWITVGYFQVQSPPLDSTGTALPFGPGTPYPDGYQLMAEMGSDTGEVERHRGFYIFDRSIPVAFEPGKNHNFEEGLLLRRFIE